jgi:DNA repair protein RadC
VSSQENLFTFVPQVEVTMIGEVELSSSKFGSSEEVAKSKFAQDLLKSDREKFICIHLNVRNQIISFEIVSTGSLTSSIVHPREVFKAAILANAAGLVFMHNHPSGDPNPSLDDIEITKRLVKAGNLLGIEILDHVIVGRDGFYSFRQHNLITS